jgi:serum/glucocorticoid-regulated kinase 2
MFKFGKSKESKDAKEKEVTSPAKSVGKEPPLPTAAPPANPTVDSAKDIANDSNKKPFQSGLLNIKVVEARNLEMPEEHANLKPGGSTGRDLASLPFVVIELDKNEVVMRAVEASPSSNTVQFQTKANLYHNGNAVMLGDLLIA